MYCPACGGPLAKTLSYCNHCGANLKTSSVDGETETTETMINTLVFVIFGAGIAILGMALGTLVLIKEGKIDAGLGVALAILIFVTLGLVEGVLLWRLVHLNRRAQAAKDLAQPKDLRTEELNPAPQRALHEPGEPVPTVTDQTTRSLEPSYRDREQR